jgi:hypothetical protein
MAAISNSFFWLVDFYKSSLKLLGQMNRNLMGSTYICMEGSVLNFLKAE